MDISLTPELEKLVHDKVASRLYNSVSEVICESLRLLQEHDKIKEFRLSELKKELQKGIDQIERSEFTVYDVESVILLGEEIKQRGTEKKQPFVDLDSIFNHAVEQTEQMLEHGFYLTDPNIVTPLGWYANKYPEIAERCNHALMALIEKQAAMYPELLNADYEIDLDSF